ANGSLFVNSAGNTSEDNSTVFSFPSNLNGVLAVGSTTNNDIKSSFSNYGLPVQVYAPGDQVLSAVPDNGYALWSGTSFSSPLTAGVAALVKTQHPDGSADQDREQIRVTADNIDSNNPNFAGLLGNGRVNAFRAVTESSPAVQVADVSFSDTGGDGRVDVGETANLTVRFTNFLANATNLSFDLTSQDANISIVNSSGNLAALNTGDTLGVTFQFSLANSVQEGYTTRFITNISSASIATVIFLRLRSIPRKCWITTPEI
ncbi:MAG: S8 family serine peptidase, partial [bacterium]